MKRLHALLLGALTCFFLMPSCNEEDTYADMKERETDQINAFLRNGCTVLDEEFSDTLLHVDPINVIEKGVGEPLANGETATIINRFTEFNIASDSIQSTNNSMYYETVPDIMTCKNSDGLFTASFTQGVMYTRYSASVPSGWLTPLTFINLGRKSAPGENIAHVRLIVPSTEGHNDANSFVYACFYDITYMRSR